jgi:proliferating cell nuclear antigen PCNA
MELVISESTLFKRAMEAVRDFLPEPEMNISADGMRITGMDAAHICFIDFLLSAEECDSLTCPDPISLGISTGLITKVLSAAATGSDTITLSVTEESDQLGLRIENAAQARRADFELPLLDIEDAAVEVPEMTYEATVKAKTADIVGMVRDCALFGEAVTLRLDGAGFHMEAVGETGGKAKLTLENTDGREMTLEDDAVAVTYSIKYLMNILKGGASLASVVDLAFESGKPIRAVFRFGRNSHFTAYLAPKIED